MPNNTPLICIVAAAFAFAVLWPLFSIIRQAWKSRLISKKFNYKGYSYRFKYKRVKDHGRCWALLLYRFKILHISLPSSLSDEKLECQQVIKLHNYAQKKIDEILKSKEEKNNTLETINSDVALLASKIGGEK